ncbi:hypothetical protein HG530_005518 [Fusarium avenaceum]|nr:hypothetical protein HG530_005518 [Fusarium avenaceum]
MDAVASSMTNTCGVLRHDGDVLSQILKTDSANLQPINENLALVCLKRPEDCQSQRTLACTCSSHNADLLLRLNLERDVLQDGVELLAIACCVVHKLNRSLLRPVCWWSAVLDDGVRFLLDIQIFLDTLHRVHVLLVDCVKSYKPQHTLGEAQRVTQGNTRRTRISLTEVENEEHASEESHEVSHKISPERQPSIAGPQVDEGSTLGVNLLQVVPDEPSLVAVGSNGRHAAQGFTELLEQGTTLDCFKTLQVARGSQVKGSDEVEQNRNTSGGVEELGSDVCNEANRHQKRNATADHTNRDGCNLLINSLQILAETVHQLTERRNVEELELGSCHRCYKSIMNLLGSRQRAQEDPQISKQSCKGTCNSDGSKDG